MKTSNTIDKNNNVLVLTLSLMNGNYGGILQAYALQVAIRKSGLNVATDISLLNNRRTLRRTLGNIKLQLMRHKSRNEAAFLSTNLINNLIVSKTVRFVHENITTVEIFDKKRRPIISTLNNFKYIVVGSDQVWRSTYADIPMYLLDFVRNSAVKKISYAASFGKDDLSEYGPKLIKQSAVLAKRFNAVSVREDSGVEISKK